MSPLAQLSDYIVVLSDLHLADGYTASGEMFFSDEAFAHFLEYLRVQSDTYQCPCTLLLLGDVVDFLHVRDEQSPHYQLTSSHSTIEDKLQRIVEGHPIFFKALANFAAEGFHVHIVPGNHDIELIQPAIQQRFKQHLAACGTSSATLQTVCFFPWIYYVPDLLYAEHGQQYHDINSFYSLLELLVKADTTAIKHPPGAYLDEYLFNKRDFSAKYIKPPFWHHLRFVLSLLSTLLKRTLILPRHPVENRDLLGGYGDIELSHDILVALDRLALVSTLPMLARLCKKILGRSYTSVSIAMYKQTQRIHELLRAHGQDVPFYVFGHTHKAAMISLFQNNDKPYYLNSGTWTRKLAEVESNNEPFTFVEIIRDVTNDIKQVHLMGWYASARVVSSYDSHSIYAANNLEVFQ